MGRAIGTPITLSLGLECPLGSVGCSTARSILTKLIMSSILSHLLAHHLAQNSQVPAALDFIKQVINQDRAINRAIQQEGVDGPVVHR